MPIVRRMAGGAAVTIPSSLVDQYRSKGWVVDEKPKPKTPRRKPASDESE